MIKSAEEIAAMRVAIDTCERGMARMHETLTPGMTEADLWSILHAENIRGGGEWIETRLLASGPRTNPWFQEASLRPIEAGDMVTYDTDLIGPFGYCADISRAVICGGGPPTDEQKYLYALAHEQIEFNIDLVRPGIGLREFSEKSFRLPDDCLPNRYSVVAHGVGLCDEHPRVLYSTDFPASGYDGVIEAGMTVCIESYVGRVGGSEGVKLEEQVLVTETGVGRLSTFAFERTLLAP
jgi:Xaa-Pro aminopeptidase